ncbi:hypothetical protein A8A01_03060 [Ewingella americana]|nr:hypothetical protein A8A01_03060 [Ewingella americana]
MATTSKLQDYVAEQLAQRDELMAFFSSRIEQFVDTYASSIGSKLSDLSLYQGDEKKNFNELELSGSEVEFSLCHQVVIENFDCLLCVDLCATRESNFGSPGDYEMKISSTKGSEMLTEPSKINDFLNRKFQSEINSLIFPVS